MTTRRTFLTGLTGFVACSPAIVRASSLMAIKPFGGRGVGNITLDAAMIRDLLFPGLGSIMTPYGKIPWV